MHVWHVRVTCIVASLVCSILALVIGVVSNSAMMQSVEWSELTISEKVKIPYEYIGPRSATPAMLKTDQPATEQAMSVPMSHDTLFVYS